MTDTTPTPPTPTMDDKPDFAAEIARLDDMLKGVPDEIAALNAKLDAELDYDGLAAQFEAELTAEQRAALPKTGSKLDRVFHRIVAIVEANKRPRVPATDTKAPSLTPPQTDFNMLPAHARIAAGYGKA